MENIRRQGLPLPDEDAEETDRHARIKELTLACCLPPLHPCERAAWSDVARAVDGQRCILVSSVVLRLRRLGGFTNRLLANHVVIWFLWLGLLHVP